jgi:hypothetical protein
VKTILLLLLLSTSFSLHAEGWRYMGLFDEIVDLPPIGEEGATDEFRVYSIILFAESPHAIYRVFRSDTANGFGFFAPKDQLGVYGEFVKEFVAQLEFEKTFSFTEWNFDDLDRGYESGISDGAEYFVVYSWRGKISSFILNNPRYAPGADAQLFVRIAQELEEFTISP